MLRVCAAQTSHRGQRHWLGKFYMISGVESDPQQLSTLPGLLSSQPLVQSKAVHSSCFLFFFPWVAKCSWRMDGIGRGSVGPEFLWCFCMLWVLEDRDGQPISFWDSFNNLLLSSSNVLSRPCAVGCHCIRIVPSLKDAQSLVGEWEVRKAPRQDVNSAVQCVSVF